LAGPGGGAGVECVGLPARGATSELRRRLQRAQLVLGERCGGERTAPASDPRREAGAEIDLGDAPLVDERADACHLREADHEGLVLGGLVGSEEARDAYASD